MFLESFALKSRLRFFARVIVYEMTTNDPRNQSYKSKCFKEIARMIMASEWLRSTGKAASQLL